MPEEEKNMRPITDEQCIGIMAAIIHASGRYKDLDDCIKMAMKIRVGVEESLKK